MASGVDLLRIVTSKTDLDTLRIPAECLLHEVIEMLATTLGTWARPWPE
ncbi:MAG: hypothetical protein ACRDTG_27775 [Pseudonocardiaceae bacterium]